MEHPIYVGRKRFILASKLLKGDFIYIQDNGKLKKEIVIETTKVLGNTMVYSIGSTGTYFANGIAVQDEYSKC